MTAYLPEETMLTAAERAKAADILMEAQRTKTGGPAHTTFPNIAIEDSYAISTEVAKRKIRPAPS